MTEDLAPIARNRRRTLVGMLVAGIGAAAVLASGAHAGEPPIVSVESGSGGRTDVCLSDQHSQADPSASDLNGAVQLNDASCEATSDNLAPGSSAEGATSKGNDNASKHGSSAAASVAAANAVGLRIVRIRHVTRRVGVTNRFRVLVTLRDLRGRPVREAIVSVSRVPGARRTIQGTYSSFSSKRGQATLVVPVSKRMLGTRLFLKISARTPSERATTLRSVFLPRRG